MSFPKFFALPCELQLAILDVALCRIHTHTFSPLRDGASLIGVVSCPPDQARRALAQVSYLFHDEMINRLVHLVWIAGQASPARFSVRWDVDTIALDMPSSATAAAFLAAQPWAGRIRRLVLGAACSAGWIAESAVRVRAVPALRHLTVEVDCPFRDSDSLEVKVRILRGMRRALLAERRAAVVVVMRVRSPMEESELFGMPAFALVSGAGEDVVFRKDHGDDDGGDYGDDDYDGDDHESGR